MRISVIFWNGKQDTLSLDDRTYIGAVSKGYEVNPVHRWNTTRNSIVMAPRAMGIGQVPIYTSFLLSYRRRFCFKWMVKDQRMMTITSWDPLQCVFHWVHWNFQGRSLCLRWLNWMNISRSDRTWRAAWYMALVQYDDCGDVLASTSSTCFHFCFCKCVWHWQCCL